jgi:hypothetical protein
VFFALAQTSLPAWQAEQADRAMEAEGQAIFFDGFRSRSGAGDADPRIFLAAYREPA